MTDEQARAAVAIVVTEGLAQRFPTVRVEVVEGVLRRLTDAVIDLYLMARENKEVAGE